MLIHSSARSDYNVYFGHEGLHFKCTKSFKTTRWVLFPQEHILLISRYKLIKINTTVREISVSLSFKTSYLWVYVYVCVKARYRLHILLWIYVVFVDSRNAYTFRYFSPSLQVSIWILDLIKYCVWRALTILTTIAYSKIYCHAHNQMVW